MKNFLTISDVFIIESLPAENPHDGKLLFDVLKMMGKNPIYRKVKDADDFENALNDYKQSKYRFLHISCHGNKSQVFFEEGMVDYLGFGNLFANHSLPVTRIFFSACCLGNQALSKAIITANKAVHSIVAPTQKIPFDLALIAWSTFYVKAFGWNRDGISENTILMTMRQIANLFLLDFDVSSLHTDNMKIYSFPIIPEKHILQKARKPIIIPMES